MTIIIKRVSPVFQYGAYSPAYDEPRVPVFVPSQGKERKPTAQESPDYTVAISPEGMKLSKP